LTEEDKNRIAELEEVQESHGSEVNSAHTQTQDEDDFTHVFTINGKEKQWTRAQIEDRIKELQEKKLEQSGLNEKEQKELEALKVI